MLTIVAAVGFVGYLSLFFEVGTAIKGLPTVAVVKNGDRAFHNPSKYRRKGKAIAQ